MAYEVASEKIVLVLRRQRRGEVILAPWEINGTYPERPLLIWAWVVKRKIGENT